MGWRLDARALFLAALDRLGGAYRTVSRRGHRSALDLPVLGPPPKNPSTPRYLSPARRHSGTVTALPICGQTRHAASSLHRPFHLPPGLIIHSYYCLPSPFALRFFSSPSPSSHLLCSFVLPFFIVFVTFLRRKSAQAAPVWRDKDLPPPDLQACSVPCVMLLPSCVTVG